MKKENYKRAYELFGFPFLGFEIGANRFSIKFCIRRLGLIFFKNVGIVLLKTLF